MLRRRRMTARGYGRIASTDACRVTSVAKYQRCPFRGRGGRFESTVLWRGIDADPYGHSNGQSGIEAPGRRRRVGRRIDASPMPELDGRAHWTYHSTGSVRDVDGLLRRSNIVDHAKGM